MTFSLFANKQQHQREIQLFAGAESGGGRVYTSFSQFPPAVRGTPTVLFWKTKKMITGRNDVQAFLQVHQRAKPPQQRATRTARPPAPVEPPSTVKTGRIYDNHSKIATMPHAAEVPTNTALPRDLPVVDLPVDEASKEKRVDAARTPTKIEPSVPSTEARISDGEDRASSTASSDPVERSIEDKIDTPPPLDKEESCVDLPSATSIESTGETIERDPPAKKKRTKAVRFADEVDASSSQKEIDENGETSESNPIEGDATISAASDTATQSVDLAVVEPKKRTRRKKKSDVVAERVAEANVQASEEFVEPAPKKKRAPRKKKVVVELS